jgi:hypothetical protein
MFKTNFGNDCTWKAEPVSGAAVASSGGLVLRELVSGSTNYLG